MGLRFASEAVKRIDLGEGDFIAVREEVSKGAFKRIMQLMPQKEINTDEAEDAKLTLTQGEAVEYQTALFAALVVGWSLDRPPTIENYEALENESASEIDRVLGEHFNGINAKKEELGKPSTSPAKQRKG